MHAQQAEMDINSLTVSLLKSTGMNSETRWLKKKKEEEEEEAILLVSVQNIFCIGFTTDSINFLNKEQSLRIPTRSFLIK